MCRLLIIDADERERRFVAALASSVCDSVLESSNLKAAQKLLEHRRKRPSVIVAGLDPRRECALRVLELLRKWGLSIPMVVLVARGAGMLVAKARKLGARVFVQRPIESSALGSAIREAANGRETSLLDAPPLTDEERTCNLSQLESRLNASIKCSVGRGLVTLHSFIVGPDTKTPPRVCLRCPLREDLGMQPYVYYEHIRDVCCASPYKCELLQAFAARTGRHFPELENDEQQSR